MRLLSAHVRRENKEGPAWIPAEIGPCPPLCRNSGTRHSRCNGGELHRLNANVLSITALVFDLDHLPSLEAQAVLDRVRDAGLRAVAHSTHSDNPEGGENGVGDRCLRLVLFPSRPLHPEENKAVRKSLIRTLGIPADPATSDLARLYFLPSCPPSAEPFTWVSPAGHEVEVDTIVTAKAATKAAAANAPLPAANLTVDVDAIRAALEAAEPASAQARALFKVILAGEPLAAKGAHDTTMHLAARTLATYLPGPPPGEAVLALAETSLRRMDWEDGWEHCKDAFIDKYERAVEDTLAYRAQRAAQIEAMLTSMRLKAAEHTVDPLAAELSPTGAYTEEALQEWALEEDEWIIQKRDTYWVFIDGQYVPRDKAELATTLHRDLVRSPVPLVVEGKKGPKELAPGEIVRANGTVAGRVVASLALQRSRYDRREGIFYEAVCPLRKLEPRHDPQIQAWLEALGGSQEGKLLDWVATVTNTERQTCVLYVYGPKGIGKTVLAQGLARLWTPGAPPSLEQLLADYNDALTQCPLIYADEKLPDRRGMAALIRETTGVTDRQLKRKYMPAAPCKGAIRLLVTANTAGLLATNEDITAVEQEATVERVLYIEATAAASDYLATISAGGPPVADRWIKEDLLARHALWLRDNRAVPDSGRFLVTGHRQKLHDLMSTNSKTGRAVMDILAKFLNKNKGRTNQEHKYATTVLVGGGQLLVNVAAIEALWAEFAPNSVRDLPNTQVLAKTLASISDGSMRARLNGTQRRYWAVKVDQVARLGDESGLLDYEEIMSEVRKPNATVAAVLAGKTDLAEVSAA